MPSRDPGAGSDDRRGLALSVILWALVVAGAFLTIAAFIGFHEQRAAANRRRLERARIRAESELVSVLRDRTPGALNRSLPRPFDSLVAAPSGARVINRLGDGLFLYRVAGSDTGPGGTPPRAAIVTRLGLLVGVRPVAVDVPAGLTTGGTAFLGEGTVVDGADTPPPSWQDCPTGVDSVAGVSAESLAVSGPVSISGLPPIDQRQSGDSEVTALRSTFDTLASQATLLPSSGSWQTPPQRSGSNCDTRSPLNWGDPAWPEAVCGGYLPVIHVQGDATLDGGEGQGILLVQGNLRFQAGFRFFGLVLVRGRIEVSPGVGEVTLQGAVFAGGVGREDEPVNGLKVTFSKCVIDRALRSSGRLVALRSRAWKQLFEVP